VAALNLLVLATVSIYQVVVSAAADLVLCPKQYIACALVTIQWFKRSVEVFKLSRRFEPESGWLVS